MVYLIGDPGSTHGGTLKGALECVDVAKEAGCDSIKFQLFRGNAHGNIELPRRHWEEIVAHARTIGIDIFASVFDEEAIYMLKNVGIKKAKLAYSQNFNLRLIKTLKDEGFEIWASGDEDNYPNYADVKLFCVPEYPVKTMVFPLPMWSNQNFDGISLHKVYPFEVPTFYSGTLSNPDVPHKNLEVHFHTHKKVDCPDYWFSLSPKELKQLVEELKK